MCDLINYKESVLKINKNHCVKTRFENTLNLRIW